MCLVISWLFSIDKTFLKLILQMLFSETSSNHVPNFTQLFFNFIYYCYMVGEWGKTTGRIYIFLRPHKYIISCFKSWYLYPISFACSIKITTFLRRCIDDPALFFFLLGSNDVCHSCFNHTALWSSSLPSRLSITVSQRCFYCLQVMDFHR